MRNLKCCFRFNFKILNVKKGTARYLAPECFQDQWFLKNNKFNSTIIEEFKQTDIYSFALVCWELIEWKSSGQHKIPFYEHLNETNKAEYEIMKEIVAIQDKRPTIPHNTDVNIIKIIEIIKECWQTNPKQRPISCRIKQNIYKLFSQYI
jgi:TGF-beta receptor type-2